MHGDELDKFGLPAVLDLHSLSELVNLAFISSRRFEMGAVMFHHGLFANSFRWPCAIASLRVV